MEVDGTPEPDEHRCATCGEGFDTSDDLAAHERQVHGDGLTPETPGQLG